jgi:hypothetical protein
MVHKNNYNRKISIEGINVTLKRFNLNISLFTIAIAVHIAFIFSLFPFAAANGEKWNIKYNIYDEIKISSNEMNCDYSLEDYRRLSYDFEYPKLIIKEKGSPIIVFVDENSNELVFVEISGKSITIINSIPSFGENLFEKWPVVFEKEDEIHLAVMKKILINKKWQYQVRLLLLEGHNRFSLKKEYLLTHEEVIDDSFLSGIYPYSKVDNKFIAVGWFYKSYFHPLSLFSGDFPTFKKNFSLIWGNNKNIIYNPIEEKGWFGAYKRVYAISDSEIVHSAWIRNTSRVGLSSKHNEAVYYSENSENKDEIEWKKPLEIYSVKGTEEIDQIRNLSLSSHGHSAFLLWQDIEQGFYFAEIKDGIQYEISKISDIKHVKLASETPKYIESLYGASTTKVAVDHNGNVYALWAWNSELKYHIFLKSRVNGKWTQTIVINSGFGTVKLPDLKVVEKGIIHVVYIKETPKEKYACYYLKIDSEKQ